MGILKKELDKEKKRLKDTLNILNEIIDSKEIDIKKLKDNISTLKKYIWENNYDLDDTEIAMGMYEADKSVNRTNDQITELARLKKSLTNPYFGRVDFKTAKDEMPIYIGLNGIQKNLNFYVYDWRTPIASLFYNYGIGKASYDAPVGKISGNIILKRQYKIENGNILRCFDSDLNIDDEYLQEILSKSSSSKMSNIVSTIQQDQNRIIRNIDDKYLIVQGMAGSGKTSVALHRIAYLMYRQQNLNSNNILIFSPSDVFSKYISNVLPELGEENVLQTTFSDLSSVYIKNYKKIETFTEFVERYYINKNTNKSKQKSIKFKLSDRFKSFIDDSINKFNNGLLFEKELLVNNRKYKTEKLNNLLKNRFVKLPVIERVSRISEYICNDLNISYKRYGTKLKKQLLGMLNSNIDVYEIYSRIISSDKFKELAGLEKNISFDNTKTLKYEDLIPLIYINFEINGYPKNNLIKHIIVDEAQDYTLLQFDLLKKIFDKASFTILGDVNQTINPYYKYDKLNSINGVFNNKGKYIELLRTYRSSNEIIDYTNKILNIDNVCSVRKNNDIPVKTREVLDENAINQLTQDINIMKEEGLKRIAVITKNKEQVQKLYKELKDIFNDISLIREKQKGDIKDLAIVPSYISKGLEFDGVISYTDKDNMYNEDDKYLFYVVCTRAQNGLTVYNQDKIKQKVKK